MTDRPVASERALLHRYGTQGGWGNLGLWPGAADYAAACTALAAAVAGAAGLQPGAHVLSVACGAGDELRLWAEYFAAGRVVGTEIDPNQAALAHQQALCSAAASCITVLEQGAPGLALASPIGGAADPFDVLLCVDAAYHFAPRAAFLRAALALLRPGGRIAFTDLVLERAQPSRFLSAAARLCGVPPQELIPLDAQVSRLQEAGFADVRAQRLDDAVLGGFASFVQRQTRELGRDAWSTAWLRPALTARLIPHCRAAGLGYALLSASKPPTTPTPSTS